MLELINAERVRAGVGPVVLGDNVAAQLHAEDALENCFSSHWGMDGLKPYMRYSLAGGYQSNGENVSGIDYCYMPSSGYAALGPIEQEIREAMNGFMGSPGHRDNILRPSHRKVNIGLAWDVHNFRLVQHFEGDHVEYSVVPVIEDDVLLLSGTVKNGVLFRGSTDLTVGVFYDPPPHGLTRGQLARTYCVDAGPPVAFLRLPLTGNSYYPDDEFRRTYIPCPDPYEVSADASPPRSPGEAHDLWQAAYDASQARAGTNIRGRWVTASEWHARDSSFSVEADLSDVLADHGPGVYTVIVWGWQLGAADKVIMSEYSIFYGLTPPDTYAPKEFPTVTPAQAVTPAQTDTPTATDYPTSTPTATVASSPVPTATSTLDATASPSPIPTATASPIPTAASFSLRGFTSGPWLEQEDPQLASSIRELGWVLDGIDETESKAIQDLLYVAFRDAKVASSIVSLGWVQDGIEDVEAEAIGWMGNVVSADVTSSVVSLGWVQDGIDAVEVRAIENLSYITTDDAEVASSIISLGWVQDDIDPVEVKAIENLSYVAYRDAGIASSIVSLGWVEDGIEDAEVGLIENFLWITNRYPGAALRIAGMPFLETIEAPDISAIEALSNLAALMPETFVRVISHPALLDGISSDIAPVIATLHGVAQRNPGLIDVLLDRTRVSLERRVIKLPLAGEVVLVIIRTAPGAERSMDLLEHFVRGVEEFMGVPLPTGYVGLLFEDAVAGSSPGANFGTHIAILAEFDVDDGSHEAKITGRALAHEVGHYYWSGNEDWVDEGAADFMASVIEGVRTGSPIGANNPPCGHAGNISELESLGIDQGDVEFGCNYSLGERLFGDLYRMLGEERFQRGFRTLYLKSEIDDDAGNRRDTSVGIEHIRDAFRSDDGAESAVIARWYDGTGPHDLSRLDTTPVDSSLSSINGRIDEAYIITTRDGPAVSIFSAQNVTDWVYLRLNYSYNVSGGPHEVPLEIVEFYEDGFKFSRRSHEITAEARFVGGGGLFPVGPPPWHKWKPGLYWVYVYAGDRKVAEVQYEVTP